MQRKCSQPEFRQMLSFYKGVQILGRFVGGRETGENNNDDYKRTAG